MDQNAQHQAEQVQIRGVYLTIKQMGTLAYNNVKAGKRQNQLSRRRSKQIYKRAGNNPNTKEVQEIRQQVIHKRRETQRKGPGTLDLKVELIMAG